jgi:hypothetical protein
VVPSCGRIAARDLGGRGADPGTFPAGEVGHGVIHVFWAASVAVSLPMHLKPGTDALAAGSLAEIGHRGGNLEGAIELLLGAERIMRDRVVADARQSRTERSPGRKDVELDRPFVAKHLTGSGRGARRQCHQWHVSRSRGGLAERFGDRIGILQGDRETAGKRNRLLERGADLALLVEGVDSQAAPEGELSRVVGSG